MQQTSLDLSLVRIRTIEGDVVGAGFLIGERQVLTCAHVAAQALGQLDDLSDPPTASIVLDFPLLAPRIRLAARVILWRPVEQENGGDIAGLELLGDHPTGARAVQFTLAKDVWEHSFLAFGFPPGQDDGVWATGQLLGRQASNWLLVEGTKAEGFAVAPGFSGGPVWDCQLQGVVGMVVASSRRSETKAAFVIPYDVLASSWPCIQPIQHQRVFLSAAPEDMAFAKRVGADLRSQGIVVWDELDKPAHADLPGQESVRQAIRDAQALLLVASPQAYHARTVKEHLRLADFYQRRLIVAWVGDSEHAQPQYAECRDAALVDLRNASYDAGLHRIEAALSQSRSLATLFESPEEKVKPEPRNPYKGLRAFTPQDEADFFGRGRLVNELIKGITDLLAEEKSCEESKRCLAIIGPSGSGKSSVAMAGLLPQLQRGAIPGSEKWIYLEPMIPGKHPIKALARVLKPHFSDTSFKNELNNETARGLHVLAMRLTKEQKNKVVLLVDQFEEIFTQTETESERQQFIDLLQTAATTPSGPLLVLLTLRADFYDRPMQYPSLSRLIEAHQQQVLPMDLEDLRATIEQPAAHPDVQLSFEGNLVGDLLFEVQGQIGALPLLQFTLEQLFERRDEHCLTLQAYHEIGGVKGALSQHTERTYFALPSDEHRSLARTLFLRLLEPGASQQDTTRRRAAISEFTFDDPTHTRLMRETIDAFIAARLLTACKVGEDTTIEVSHEAVIREWKRLAGWLADAREDIQLQQSLSADVARWEQRKRPKDRLYRGTQLKDAQAWARRNKPSEREMAFLRASAARRMLALASLVVILLLLIPSLGIAAWAGWMRLHPPDYTLVKSLQDNDILEGSLRWCLKNAPSGSTITFRPGLRGTIELIEGDLTIPGGKQFTLAGPGANQLTITGGERNAHIHVSRQATLKVSGLSFKNSVTYPYGFLVNEGNLSIARSVISGNKNEAGGSGYGGGITNEGTLLISDNTIISSNSSYGNDRGLGGGIYNYGRLRVIHSTFLANSARSDSNYSYGGGIYNFEQSLAIVSDSTFFNNSASGKNYGQGGGIDNEGHLTIDHSTFSNNSASSSSDSGFGGGIYNYQTGIVTVSDTAFSRDQVSGKQDSYGGGISNSGRLTVINSSFSDDTAGSSDGQNGYGGGIYNYKTGKAAVTGSTFQNDLANGRSNSRQSELDNDGGQLTISHDTFSDRASGNPIVPLAAISSPSRVGPPFVASSALLRRNWHLCRRRR